MTIIKMADVELTDKRVLIREDLNVPVQDGVITSDARLQAALPTIIQALEAGAKVMVMSHLGRPTEGEFEDKYSLKPVADYLAGAINYPVRLVKDYLSGVDVASGELVIFENVRFNKGEKENDDVLAKQLANLCDVFVMDAFGTAHRAQASTHGVAKYAPIACGGPLLVNELAALAKAIDNPARPLVAIVGGSKVSTKLTVLDALSKIADTIVVGGGISNTFVAAAGKEVGKSLYEPDLIPEAQRLCKQTEIVFADDVTVTRDGFSDWKHDSVTEIKSSSDVDAQDDIIDYGPATSAKVAEIIKTAGTILWNGPVGVFEIDAFAKGTEVISNAIADSFAFSIAGGGDTLAAVDKYNIKDRVSYISTGGGAFLEFLEGKKLPAVEILEQRAKEQ
ncbi:phosphoglycerate kinase [Colwellia sp. 1_MG-2023]|uniref:phosphoglycerate kinase n=1 Tax=unclassified Colwellia TaxID=196834 RepID=UPI001C081D92|nr:MULTISPECIES: phosphoglycerate kinase [unclassified Colwellia]MBU2923157.1 phosphoglycerate kinase [Colwellia sp. C2M11]MDO6488328.1 phosphoglycerate kinase [Colwellia sp. 6_MG-2023]MDO6651414.1 phosphoglycerate kinase [Colwellia sp. 3_MG-2023]MDO6664163.1 phosphoglycerate kinase [Colwellia sp. 2_MG-2023]MDO6688723.1 phosphoglycerate kinase [Colwellia sp. 1_MG-2023]